MDILVELGKRQMVGGRRI
ncbi:hypothetical protein MJ579_16930 [Klebsiella pneumoniae]|nr:hypothetical protein MJ579_16930 [Klebsiella pneumoniae]